jgi:hypothetical protein
MITINGKQYPFEAPTHRQVGNEEIKLTEAEIKEILIQWAAEFDKPKSDNNF